MKNPITFLHEVRQEVSKVTWPTWKEVWITTAMVLVMVALTSIFFLLADQIILHDNQAGEGFLPQPAILPGVDLVITHGGNNTVTEAFHHGKPMIVLPLFWDQVDNAQRIDETGFGRRLATYDFRDEELTDAIDELLADGPLARRLIEMSTRIKSARGTVRAADLIERVARTGEPVLAG